MAYNKLSTYKTRVLNFGTDMLAVQYHETMIVKTYPEFGHLVVELNTGGWRGVTTKRKMNQAAWQFGLGYTVHQHNHEWFVTTKAGEFAFDDRTFCFDAETGIPYGTVATRERERNRAHARHILAP